MNSRERFLTTLQFGAPDRVPLPCLFQEFETETLKRWQREGMPRDVHPTAFFGFERCDLAPIYLGPIPAGDLADVEAAEEWRGADRAHEDESIDRAAHAKEAYPLSSREGWTAIRRRLNPDSPARYPRFFADYVRSARGRDYPLGIAFAGPFTTLRDWMGTKGLADALRDDPAWVGQMVADMAEFAVGAAGRGLDDLDLDFAVIRERAAYLAPQLAPNETIGRTFAPWYRRVADLLAAKSVAARIVEARGNVASIAPLWIENGVNVLAYAEVAAGLDAHKLRRTYGRALAVIGNVDHAALGGGGRDIRGELARKADLIRGGGFIPTPDRAVSAEVAFEDYQAYLEALREF